MSLQEDISKQSQKLNVGTIVKLYELDLTDVGESSTIYFTESIGRDYTPISFNSRSYTPIDIQATGFGSNSNGTNIRPKLVVSNVLLTLIPYLLSYRNLIGAKLTRRRTLERFLDGYPDANPSAEFTPDVFKIKSIPQRNNYNIEFELSSYIDSETTKVPGRLILRNYCSQIYRIYSSVLSDFSYEKATCPYATDYYYTKYGEYTTDKSKDVCGKMEKHCTLRYSGKRAKLVSSTYGKPIYIQDTQPTGVPSLTCWLDTSQVPNVWYIYNTNGNNEWNELASLPLPTYAFPSVARFR